MPLVFISHATADRAFIERELLPLLADRGLEAWYARDDIKATDQWERSILHGLRSCDYFLLVMSPRSAQSKWVKREVDWQFNKGHKPIVPVLMEDCDSDDFHLGLASIQHVDFRGDFTTARQRLLAAFGTQVPLLPPSFTNSRGMKFVLVPRGSFWMGGGTSGSRLVEIPALFYIGVYQVTQGQWQEITGTTPSYFSPAGKGKNRIAKFAASDLARFPVECVSWNDIQHFLNNLSGEEKESGWMYRLPREAEWEYACRGKPTSSTPLHLGQEDCSFDFYFGKPTNSLTAEFANFSESRLSRPQPVGSYSPNPLGIYDLHGNVWEWCEDLYEEGPYRVYRGGCWSDPAEACRAAHRSWDAPEMRATGLGFRLARVLSAGCQEGP